VLHKVKQLVGQPGFTNCDPHKIKQIISKTEEVQTTNQLMRDCMHSVGVTVNQMARSSVQLKNDAYVTAGMDGHLRDIGSGIDKLNQLFNDCYLKVLENDTRLNDVQTTCKTTLSHQSHL